MKKYNWEDIQIECHVEFEETRIDFKMYEIVGHSKGKSGIYDVPLYEEKNKDGSIGTEDIKKAEAYIKGQIKWDACSHIYFGDEEGYMHVCGGDSWKQLVTALDRVYKIAREHFKEDHQKDFFNEYDLIIK